MYYDHDLVRALEEKERLLIVKQHAEAMTKISEEITFFLENIM
jgi:hypothetical protein